MLGLIFLVFVFATQTFALNAQTVEKPKPLFSLSIEASDPSHPPTFYTSDRRVVLVTYTNISDVDESNSDADLEFGFNMHVLLDGAPAQETGNMRSLRERRNPTKVSKHPIMGSYRSPTIIKPGKSITLPLPIADYFDMTKPGTYTITVSKETFPGNPANSVTVRSNTITIVVPEPVADTPK
jgi:hypothetical protein